MISAFLLATLSARAQVDRGGPAGTVKDSSGLVAPRATIDAAENATGLRRAAAASGSGTYDLPELPVGTHTLSRPGTFWQ